MTAAGLLLSVMQHLTPLSTLTYLSAKLTDAKSGGLTQFMIKSFIKEFHIDLSECADPDPTHYETFNSFFTRPLKEGARPISSGALVCPADGTLGQIGKVTAGRLIQAKGIDYSLISLVGGLHEDAERFQQGWYATVYLSPSNYHRVHIPCDGTLIKTVHIPGRLFPVGRRNIAHMPDLYTKNERLVCFFKGQYGTFAVIFVGAALVGSIATVWGGTVVRRRNIEVTYFKDAPEPLTFKKGAEIGLFKYGSTVITLWEPQAPAPRADLTLMQTMRMGQDLTA